LRLILLTKYIRTTISRGWAGSCI